MLGNDPQIHEVSTSGYAPSAPDARQILPDEATAPFGAYQLPTGYLDEAGVLHRDVVVREITGVEEDLLGSRKMPIHVRMEKIIQNCTESIGTLSEKNSANWSRIIKGLPVSDRLFLLLKIRTVSIGAPFKFKTQCTSCGEVSDQVVSLDDFKISGLPDPSVRHWKGVLPRSKKPYTAKVQTGFEEEKIASLSTSEDMLTLAIIARLVDFDGEQPVKLASIKHLTMADRDYLRNDFKSHEGNVDNEVDVVCPKCDVEFKTAIDIGTPSFFFPSVT